MSLPVLPRASLRGSISCPLPTRVPVHGGESSQTDYQALSNPEACLSAGLPDSIGSGLNWEVRASFVWRQGLCGHGSCILTVRGKAPDSGVCSETLWLPSVKTWALNREVVCLGKIPQQIPGPAASSLRGWGVSTPDESLPKLSHWGPY